MVFKGEAQEHIAPLSLHQEREVTQLRGAARKQFSPDPGPSSRGTFAE